MPQKDSEKVRKRYFRRTSSKVCYKKGKSVGELQKCIDEANGYLQKIAKLDSDASKDVKAENRTRVSCRNEMKATYETVTASLRRLDEALSFLCHIADIDVKAISSQHTVSLYIDEANDYLLKIAKLRNFQDKFGDTWASMLGNTKNVAETAIASPNTHDQSVPDRCDMSEQDLDGLWDAFVRERAEMSGTVQETQDAIPTLPGGWECNRYATAVDDADKDPWDEFIAERAANNTPSNQQKKGSRGKLARLLKRLFGRK